ncbi:MAG: AAA family ATPase [Desulfobacterales bacterium]|nr:AAA family ATPase [Desulfobacterales bacterium]MBL7101326.1 AAA family ATPase [Desulfobacteraceae bacterium]MBL7171245.1 AAA family ATPase [Desulfobacteraceae bacterium]
MYTAYFGLTENPFSLTPDPRFLFMSQRHREALAHLLFGIGERGGFVLLTGEVGTGKTTLCRSLLEQIPQGVEAALVLNPKQTAIELVASLCDELKVSYPPGTNSLKVLIDRLNLHLLEIHAKGRRTVLIIDEAQNLSTDVLEQVRLLTNLETSTRKLLQILLIGQPELQTMMARPELRQLGQRITARYHLAPLMLNETAAYIQHRLEVAGCKRRLFTRGTLRLAHRLSGGVPRLINTICDRALLGAYAKQRESVGSRLLRKAASEVMGPGPLSRTRRLFGWAIALAVCLLLWAGWQFLLAPMVPEQVLVTEGKLAKSAPPATPAGGNLKLHTPEVNTRQRAALPEKLEGSMVPERPREVGGEGSRSQISQEVSEKGADTGRASIMLGEFLKTGKGKTDIDTAFETLFDRWQARYPVLPGMTACERAAKAGLRCFSGKGNWTTLRHLNRPAILELIDAHQGRHFVPAVQMEDRNITLDFGNRQATLDRAEIEPFWFGDFTLLWKPPPFRSFILKKGDTGPEVLWLKARLDHAEGVHSSDGGEARTKAPSSGPLFDEKLRMRVMEFQRTHFIKADGIVGEQTLIQLNKATANSSIPLLYSQPQNGERHVIYP